MAKAPHEVCNELATLLHLIAYRLESPIPTDADIIESAQQLVALSLLFDMYATSRK
jgi:hypothetical protein